VTFWPTVTLSPLLIVEGGKFRKEIPPGGDSTMTESELELRRRMAGLTMADLASRANVPYSRVWHGLRGTRLTADELRKLERAVTAIETANIRTAAV